MKNFQQEIVLLFDEQKLTTEEIASALELDVNYVEGVLQEFSGSFKEETRQLAKINPEDISDNEYQDYLRRYKNLALSTENEYLIEKALRHLMNEKKGRNEIAALLEVRKGSNVAININIFNESLTAARIQTEKVVKELVNK